MEQERWRIALRTATHWTFPPSCFRAGEPFVEVTYKNQKVERFACGDLSVQRVMNQITAKSAEMETAEALKAAGLAGVQLHTTFGGAGNTESSETGVIRKTMPR